MSAETQEEEREWSKIRDTKGGGGVDEKSKLA